LLVKQRIITSGNIVELLDFINPLPIGENKVNNPLGRKGTNLISLETKQENREKTIKRNTSKFWRLYNCNKDHYKEKDKFLTLTFRRLPSSITACDYELKKFIQRLQRFTKSKLQYLGTRELQLEFDRSGTHFHILLFGMPYVPHADLLRLWCKGNPYQDESKPSGVNIKGVADGFKEMSNYLTSYMLKQLIENDFMEGHKIIIQSRGLLKPIRHDSTCLDIVPMIQDIKKGLSFIDNRITYYRIQ